MLARSGQDCIHDTTMHVRKPALNTVLIKRQLQVIEPHQVQDRGMEVVNRNYVLHGAVTELVGSAVAERRLDASAGPGSGRRYRPPAGS